MASLACTGAHSPTAAAPAASSSPDAAAVARSLGRGVNFGNILDAPSEGVRGLSMTDDLFDAV
ncbi:MAG: hypothetical protein NTW72_01670, partial [Gemmatimonadetes bacterium]|nr:hypothetical protein [Gemmatimonadota bacterium]